MTHTELVDEAVIWLRHNMGCEAVFAEVATSLNFVPDVLGWKHANECHYVEAKRTRGDFLGDLTKPHHRMGSIPGHYRWYFTPPGLLDPFADVPPEWGLVEVHGRIRSIIKRAPRVESDRHKEVAFLLSTVGRFATSESRARRYNWDNAAARLRRPPK